MTFLRICVGLYAAAGIVYFARLLSVAIKENWDGEEGFYARSSIVAWFVLMSILWPLSLIRAQKDEG